VNEPPEGNLTIGDLSRSGARLGLYCDACGRFRYMKADRLDEGQNVRALAKRLSCIRCWSEDVATRPVLWDVRSGRWPAESG
jgi:hypothetical protein